MQDPQLMQVADGVRQLDGVVDPQEDIDKVKKIAHGLAATAIKALEDADLARAQAERSFRRGKAECEGTEVPEEAREPEEAAGGGQG